MSYYSETVPDLIRELKKMVKESLKIVGSKISTDLADDKMHNVIKSKQMAAENVLWGTQECDRLQDELEGKVTDEKPIENFADIMAE
jgi:hypothetical protein